ncbi:MAG: glycosyltransferase family 39 protein, partial [Candidatus Aureabacteria bacterium]|nr:glycosyltransferase family 39 protein [Candidatus Auribacterota bacterium]
MDKITQKKLDFVILLLFSSFLIFWNLSSISLWSPDEPRFGAIVRHMVRENDYLIPKFNGKNLYWKPILVYWLMAFPSKIINDATELTTRLPSALSALGIIVAFFFFLKKYSSRKTAFLAGIILITNYTFLEQSRLAIIDMTLTFFMFLATISFYIGYINKEKRRKWFLLFYVFCGLSVLSKGPVGVIVPALIVFFFLFSSRRLEVIKDMILPSGMLLFLLATLPWYIAALLEGGREFFQEFIIKQNIIRFFHAFDHIQPFYYYLDRVATHFFPWSLLLPAALILNWKDFKKEKETSSGKPSFFLFMWVWLLVVLFFFSISKSKRSQYILLLYPAMSLAVAHLCVRFFTAREKSDIPVSLLWIKVPLSLMCLLFGIFFIAFPSFVKFAGYFTSDFFVTSLFCSIVLVFLIFFIGEALTKKNPLHMGKSACARMFLFAAAVSIFMVAGLYPELDRIRSAVPYTKKINKAVGEDRLITFYFDRPEFIYYLDRGPIEVLEEDDVGKLMDYLRGKEKVYCLIRRRYYRDRLPYLKNVFHRVVLSDLKGWKWDLLL